MYEDYPVVELQGSETPEEICQIAYQLRSEGRTQEGAQILFHGMNIYPNHPLLHNGLGIIYNLEEKYDEAIAQFTLAINLNPMDYELVENRALCYVLGKYHEAALQDIFYLKKIGPQYWGGYYNHGRLYYEQGDLDSAIRELEHAHRLDPSQFRPVLMLAIAQYDRHGASHGISYLQQIIETYPRSPDLRIQLAMWLHKAAQTKTAMKQLAIALKLDCYSIGAYKAIAEIYLDVKKYDKALENIGYALQLNPDATGLLLSSAKIRSAAEDFLGAKQDLDRVIEYDPTDPERYRHRAELFFDHKSYDFCITDLDFIIANTEDNRNERMIRAFCKRKLGYTDSAREDETPVKEYYLDRFKTVARSGQIVYAHLVRAPESLFEPGFDSQPCAVVFSFEKELNRRHDYLADIVDELDTIKNHSIMLDGHQVVAEFFDFDNPQEYKRLLLPEDFGEIHQVYIAHLMLFRPFIRDGFLEAKQVLPCIAEKDDPQRLELIPYQVIDKKRKQSK